MILVFLKQMMWLYYSPLPKFENDKLFFEDKEKIVLLDGVIFNKKELLTQYKGEDWRTVYETMYQKDPHEFQNALRGSFCGAVYRKDSRELMLFTNHSGEKTICSP